MYDWFTHIGLKIKTLIPWGDYTEHLAILRTFHMYHTKSWKISRHSWVCQQDLLGYLFGLDDSLGTSLDQPNPLSKSLDATKTYIQIRHLKHNNHQEKTWKNWNLVFPFLRNVFKSKGNNFQNKLLVAKLLTVNATSMSEVQLKTQRGFLTWLVSVWSVQT